MVSQQKTRLAKLRSVLGSSGSESIFPKIVGLSPSWIKKCSSGHLPMTARAASAIHDATGVDLLWLTGEHASAFPVEADGRTPYTLESYSKWKYTVDSNEGDYPRLYNPVSLRMILRVLSNVAATKKQTVASCELFEFAQKFKAAYGAADYSGDHGAELLRTVAKLDKPPRPDNGIPLSMKIVKGRLDGKATPRKPRPSRRLRKPSA